MWIFILLTSWWAAKIRDYGVRQNIKLSRLVQDRSKEPGTSRAAANSNSATGRRTCRWDVPSYLPYINVMSDLRSLPSRMLKLTICTTPQQQKGKPIDEIRRNHHQLSVEVEMVWCVAVSNDVNRVQATRKQRSTWSWPFSCCVLFWSNHTRTPCRPSKYSTNASCRSEERPEPPC